MYALTASTNIPYVTLMGTLIYGARSTFQFSCATARLGAFRRAKTDGPITVAIQWPPRTNSIPENQLKKEIDSKNLLAVSEIGIARIYRDLSRVKRRR